MKTFSYTITDSAGIHARPAGLLVKAAREFPQTKITVACGDKSALATQLMKLMGLGARKGDAITVAAEGEREQEAIAAMEKFFREHF